MPRLPKTLKSTQKSWKVKVRLPKDLTSRRDDVTVKFFHNDAACAQSLRHYADLGINLYNPGVQTPLAELRRLCWGAADILRAYARGETPITCRNTRDSELWLA